MGFGERDLVVAQWVQFDAVEVLPFPGRPDRIVPCDDPIRGFLS